MKRVLSFLLLGLFLAAGGAAAQGFPDRSKPIRLVVPTPPGGAADLLARSLARGMTEVSGGQPVIVENKPGAETVIGMREVKTAAPDGYSVLLTSSSSVVVNPLMIANLTYDPVADYVPIAGISRIPMMLVAGGNAPFKSVQDVLAAARANPGKYTFGSSTATTRLAGEMFQQLADVKLLNVPYKGIAQAATDVSGGQLDFVFTDALSLGGHLQSGRVRPLAVTTAARIPSLPDVPPMREAGVPGYELSAWFGTWVPAGTPPAVVATLRDIVRKATKTTGVTDTMRTFTMTPMDYDGKELADLQRNDIERLGKILRAANIRPQ